MQRDDLRGCDSMYRTNVNEVWAVSSAVTHGNFNFTRFGQAHIFEPPNISPQDILQFIGMPVQRVELDQYGAIRGMQISHAGNRFRLEEGQQFSDAVVSVKRDLVTEVD